MTMTGNDPAQASEKREHSKVQKLAILLLMLAPENAAQVLKGLDEEVVDRIAAEMSNLTIVSHEAQAEVLAEFSPVAAEAATSIRGGVEKAHRVLEQAVGLFRASDLIGRVAPMRAPVAALQQIADLDANRIFHLLRNENAQTIAMLLSYLEPDKASRVLELLRPEVRSEVLERLATLSPTTTDVIEDIIDVLHRNSGNLRPRPLNQTGGVKAAAQVINALPKSLGKSVLANLMEKSQELGEAVRQKMFSFEDLGRLDVRSLQKIMQNVDARVLIVSLRAAPEDLQSTLLAALSRRAAENVREELEMMEPVKLREVEAAQLEIVEIARRLEAEGEIDLSEIS